MILQWSAPVSYQITSFIVQIYNASASTYSEYKTLCDGNSSTVISANQCSIPMTTFTSQLGYAVPQLILFKIAGSNDQGTGPFSSPNTGSVQTQTPPTQAPTVSGVSTQTTITLNWP